MADLGRKEDFGYICKKAVHIPGIRHVFWIKTLLLGICLEKRLKNPQNERSCGYEEELFRLVPKCIKNVMKTSKKWVCRNIF